MNPQQVVDRARQAQAVLENPAFRDAIDKVKEQFFEQWCATAANAVEERERLWAHIAVLGNVEAALRAAMGNGALAKVDLERFARPIIR